MRDVAAVAGVSAKTVSRVFNDDPHVTPETRQRVDAALRDLGYVPNSVATTLRTGRSPMIGVVVPDILDPFFAAIAQSAGALAEAHDVSVVLTSSGDPAREPRLVQALLRHALSGLIVAPSSAEQAYLEPWLSRTHVVFVDRQPVGLAADSFTDDNTAGGYAATTHLVGHGHRRIGVLADDDAIPTARDRLRGYRAAMLDAGLEVDEGLVVVAAAAGLSAAEAFARLERAGATALFSSNARTTMALAPVLPGSGLAVVSFGDFPLAELLPPALTYVDQNPTELGALAAQRILDRLARPDRRYRRRTVLPCALVERDSCRVTTALDQQALLDGVALG